MKKLLLILIVIILTACTPTSEQNQANREILSQEPSSLPSETISEQSSDIVSSEEKYLALLKDMVFPTIEMRIERGTFIDTCNCFFYDIDRDNVPELFFGISEYPVFEYNIYDFQDGDIIKYDGAIYDNYDDRVMRSDDKNQSSAGLEMYYSDERILINALCLYGMGVYARPDVDVLYYDILDNSITKVADLHCTLTQGEWKLDRFFTGDGSPEEEITEKEYNKYCSQLVEGLEYKHMSYVKVERVLESDNLKNGLQKAYQEYLEHELE